MKALWEHSGDDKSPIRGQRMAYPLERTNKKSINSNDKESASSRPPLILMPKKDKKEEPSISQQIIFSKWEE